MTKPHLSHLGFAAAIPLAAMAFLYAPNQYRPEAAAPVLPFQYDFSANGRLQEAETADKSSSPYWWLNSGAYFTLWNGYGSTVQNELMASDKWRKLYAYTDPGETEHGTRPQNIFRLLTKAAWTDVAQEAVLRVNRYNASTDPHRGESNGVLLFSRYQDGDTLYYAGLRVDGNAVIKKKQHGTYYTLALEKVFSGTYDRTDRPNLLPNGAWIGLRLETKNLDDHRVALRLYADVGHTGSWTLVASAIDDGKAYGGAALTEPGHGGIRSDFMDIDIDSYRAVEIAVAARNI